MDAGRQSWVQRKALDIVVGIEVGVIGGVLMLGLLMLASPLLGQSWWTLGFEAGGRGALGRIKHTAAVVFAEPLPTASAFRAEEACSYAEWIHGLGHPGGTT